MHYKTCKKGNSLSTGEEPFQCELCEKKFTKKLAFNDHKRKIHVQSKEKICTFCNKIFSTKSSLKRHMRKNHQNLIHHNFTSISSEDENNKVDENVMIFDDGEGEECPECDEKFPNHTALSIGEHLHQVFNSLENKYKSVSRRENQFWYTFTQYETNCTQKTPCSS